MKFLTFALVAIFCAATLAADYSAQEIPASIPGYTGFDKEAVKSNKQMLNTFIALGPSVVISAVNARKFAPASYSFFMRYAFRKPATNGFEVRYYYKAYDPTNKVKGKIYYGTFDAFMPSVQGLKTRLITFTVDKTADWPPQ